MLAGMLIAAFCAFAISVLGIVMALATLSPGESGSAAMNLGGLAVWLGLSILSAILIASRVSRPREIRLPADSPVSNAPPSH